MAIEFEKEILHSRILDSTKGFEENSISFERRFDPLTRRTSIMYTHVPQFRRPLGKPELAALIERSVAFECPFCPQAIDKLAMKFTTDFIPEGMIHLGESCVFPQALPISPHSAITVLSNQHFVDLPDFTEEILSNGFLASQVYLQRVAEYDLRVKYYCVLWNYMPPAGASQLHPHLQPMADYTSSDSFKELLEASQQYYQSNGTNFWSDLVAKEIELGERYIGTVGDICWLSSFAPKPWIGIDLIGIFQGRSSFFNLSQQDLGHFSQGLRKIFRYMSDRDFHSFNLCLYSGMEGEDYFWTHARIVSRFTAPPSDNSDISTLQRLLEKSHSFILPESLCEELKEYF